MKNESLPPGRQGFTLIEIIVSVFVLLLLAGLLISGYAGFNDAQSVMQTATTVKNNLRSIRSSASGGVKPASCNTLVGYQVDFTATGYSSAALCVVGGTEEKAGAVTSYTLPNAITFSPVPASIVFYARNRGASVEETITISGRTKIVVLRVLTSGVVSD